MVPAGHFEHSAHLGGEKFEVFEFADETVVRCRAVSRNDYFGYIGTRSGANPDTAFAGGAGNTIKQTV